MSTDIKFMNSRGDQFSLTYETRCADGNGNTVPCTITFFFSRGDALIRKFESEFGTNVQIDPIWRTSETYKRRICKFLNESQSSVKEKLKKKEYKMKKVRNICNY